MTFQKLMRPADRVDAARFRQAVRSSAAADGEITRVSAYWANPVAVGLVVQMSNSEWRYIGYFDDGVSRKSVEDIYRREPIHLYRQMVGWKHVDKTFDQFLVEDEWHAQEQSAIESSTGFALLPDSGIRLVEPGVPDGQDLPLNNR